MRHVIKPVKVRSTATPVHNGVKIRTTTTVGNVTKTSTKTHCIK